MMQSKAGQKMHNTEEDVQYYHSKPKGKRKNKDITVKKPQKFNPKNVQIRYLRTNPYVVEQQFSYKPTKSVTKEVMKKRPKTASHASRKKEDGSLHHSQSKKHLETMQEMTQAQIMQQQLEEQRRGEYVEEQIQEEDVEEEEDGHEQYEQNTADLRNIEVQDKQVRNVPVPQENVLYNILAENIQHVRDNLQGMRDALVPEDDPKVCS